MSEKRRRMSPALPTPDRMRGLAYSSNYCQMIDHWSLSCPNPAKDNAGKYTFTQAGRAEEKRSPRNIYEKVSWFSFRVISGNLLNLLCLFYVTIVGPKTKFGSLATIYHTQNSKGSPPSRSQMPPRGSGPAPSPCLPRSDHFVFPRPKVTILVPVNPCFLVHISTC